MAHRASGAEGRLPELTGALVHAFSPLGPGLQPFLMQPYECRYILTMLKYTVLGIVALLALTSGVPVCLEFALNLGGASHANEFSGKFYSLS